MTSLVSDEINWCVSDEELWKVHIDHPNEVEFTYSTKVGNGLSGFPCPSTFPAAPDVMYLAVCRLIFLQFRTKLPLFYLPWARRVIQTIWVRNSVGNWSISLVVVHVAGPDDVDVVLDHEALECVSASRAVGVGAVPRSVARHNDLECSQVRKQNLG
jgi:hypothetical protein